MEEKKLSIIAIIILLLISIFAIAYFLFYMEDNNSNQNVVPVLATGYENITAEKAYDLVLKSNDTANNYNLIIIDARIVDYSCPTCLNNHYKNGHLPGAILDKKLDAKVYYQDLNETSDILVYNEEDSSKTEILSFCEELVGHVYGNIYILEGGISSWTGAGYPLEKDD